MAYNQPMIYRINAFDATNQYPVIRVGFTNLSSMPSTINAIAYITNDLTDIQLPIENVTLQLIEGTTSLAIYGFTLTSTLSNGNNYTLKISVTETGTTTESNAVIFYCINEPIININSPTGTLNQNSCKIKFTYSQSNNEILNWYKIDLYKNNDTLFKTSGKIYDENYFYIFNNLENEESYYVKLSGETINGYIIDINLSTSPFTISFVESEDSPLLSLTNIYNKGYIKINTHYDSTKVLTNISKILLKRKKENDVNWITLLSIPITNSSTYQDLIFEYHDYLAKCNTKYIYALVEVNLTGEEGIYNEQEIESCFDKTFIVGKNISYDLDNTTSYDGYTRNQVVGTYETFGRKYPISVSNSTLNYVSMSTSAYLIKDISTNDFNREEQKQYIDEFTNFLVEKNAKILKDYNGNIWLLVVNDSPSINPIMELGNSIANVSFSWNEIGDVDSQDILEKCGLLPGKPIYSI